MQFLGLSSPMVPVAFIPFLPNSPISEMDEIKLPKTCLPGIVDRGYFRLKLSLTSRNCPQWLIFFKNLFHQNNCKDPMNIGGGQIRGALFNFFVKKKCPFCIFWTLTSVSKITPSKVRNQFGFQAVSLCSLHPCCHRSLHCKVNVLKWLASISYSQTYWLYFWYTVFNYTCSGREPSIH